MWWLVHWWNAGTDGKAYVNTSETVQVFERDPNRQTTSGSANILS